MMGTAQYLGYSLDTVNYLGTFSLSQSLFPNNITGLENNQIVFSKKGLYKITYETIVYQSGTNNQAIVAQVIDKHGTVRYLPQSFYSNNDYIPNTGIFIACFKKGDRLSLINTTLSASPWTSYNGTTNQIDHTLDNLGIAVSPLPENNITVSVLVERVATQ